MAARSEVYQRRHPVIHQGSLETLAGVTYTHYLQDSFLEATQVTGNLGFLESQLDRMINIYYLWNSTRDNTTGLYHRTPWLDAQEFSLPGMSPEDLTAVP